MLYITLVSYIYYKFYPLGIYYVEPCSFLLRLNALLSVVTQASDLGLIPSDFPIFCALSFPNGNLEIWGYLK